jgi:hypothetical protein
VLGFTAATGKPVMCAIIFSAKEMCERWVMSVNPLADWIRDEDDLRANTGGLDKRFPQGPVCTFKDIDVPTFCCCTENGSITGEQLADMLSVMDKNNLFDRSDGVAPFLLLDGHNSRFGLTFLTYVNELATKWNACIGVPYGICYWHEGDSLERNG